MVKSFGLMTILFIPPAGTTMVFSHTFSFICRRRCQALPQQIAKEMMIAVPMPLVVQGDDEQISVFEILQGCLPGSQGGEHHGITQGAAQAVKDGCAQQKSLNAFGLLL